ncbi:MAG: COQ9 family protein [Alphaproteobacteria bacterium]
MTNEHPHGDSLEHLKERLLLASLPHVPFKGWSKDTLAAAAAELGLERGSDELAFPGGPADLVEYFSTYTDHKMVTVLEQQNLPELKVRDRIAAGVRVRLDLLARHREAVRRVLAFLAMPQNTALGVSCLLRTVDAIWRAAGDNSTDFNYYTKRTLLAGVYAATLLYWLDDESEGCQDTFGFLDRRIANVLELGRAGSRLDQALAKLPNPFRLFADLRGRKSVWPRA